MVEPIKRPKSTRLTKPERYDRYQMEEALESYRRSLEYAQHSPRMDVKEEIPYYEERIENLENRLEKLRERRG